MRKSNVAFVARSQSSELPQHHSGHKASVSGATIQDIAAMSGFSTSTVSRAVRGYGYVRGSTAEAIRDIAVRLDYHPHEAAQALAERSAQARRRTVSLRWDQGLLRTFREGQRLGGESENIEQIASGPTGKSSTRQLNAAMGRLYRGA